MMGPGLLRNSHVKIHGSLQKTKFQPAPWLAGNTAAIRSHVRKSLLNNMEFNMDLTITVKSLMQTWDSTVVCIFSEDEYRFHS